MSEGRTEDEALGRIADRLIGICRDDLTTAEEQIVDILVGAGYLNYVPEDGWEGGEPIVIETVKRTDPKKRHIVKVMLPK